MCSTHPLMYEREGDLAFGDNYYIQENNCSSSEWLNSCQDMKTAEAVNLGTDVVWVVQGTLSPSWGHT